VPALALAGDRTAQIVDDDLRTLLRELERMATADPVARSGDDRDLAVQQAHGPLLRSDGSSDRRVRAALRTNPGPHTSFRDAGWGSPPRPRITERGVGLGWDQAWACSIPSATVSAPWVSSPPVATFHTTAPTAAPSSGATMNNHSWASAVPPSNTAGPSERAGLTLVFVMGIEMRWMRVSISPIASAPKPLDAALVVTPRITMTNSAVRTS